MRIKTTIFVTFSFFTLQNCFAAEWNGSKTTPPPPSCTPIGGNGFWNTTDPGNTNWCDGTSYSTWMNFPIANFSAGSGTVILNDSNITVGIINFNVDGYKIENTSNQLLTNGGSGHFIIFTNLGTTTEISVPISVTGANNFFCIGGGTLRFNDIENITNFAFFDGGTTIISESGAMNSSNSVIGNSNLSVAHLVLNGSLTTNSVELGVLINDNSFTVDGGIVTTSSLAIGEVVSSNNTMVITNGGQVSVAFPTIVGLVTNNNKLAISGGSTLASGQFSVGFDVSSNNNSLSVHGIGSLVNVFEPTYLRIGEFGAFNTMGITGGAHVFVAGDGVLGWGATSIQNSATISGSIWTNNGNLFIGDKGSGNTLLIQDGALVSAGNSVNIGFDSPSQNNQAIVTGSSLLACDRLNIGWNGKKHSLTISNRGVVTAIAASRMAIASSSSATLYIGTGGTPGFLITPTLTGGLGDAELVFNHNAGFYLFAPQLLGQMNVTHTGPGTTILTAANLYSGNTAIQSGRLRAGVKNAFSPNSPIEISSGGTLDVGGFDQTVLSVLNGGTVDLGAFDTLTIQGNYVQGSNATLIDRVFVRNSDFMTITEEGNLDGALEIESNRQFSTFTQYHLLHADGGVFGTFNSVTALNPLVKTSITYTPNDVFFTLQPTLNVAAFTGNECRVANQIDCISTPTCDEQIVIDALINLPVCQAATALDSIAGEQYTFLTQLNWYGNERFNRLIYNGLRPALNPNACNAMQAWVQTQGGQSFASGNHNSKGLRSTNWDFSGGIFKSFYDHYLVGVAGNYQMDFVDFYQGGDSDFYTGQASLYGAYNSQYAYVLADFIFGKSWGSFHRKIDLGTLCRRADSSPDTTQYFFYLEAGPNFCWDHVLFQPFISGNAGIYQQSAIREKHAGSLNLKIQSKTLDIYDTQLGTHIATDWDCFTFSADLAWQHRYGNTAITTTNSFDCFGCPFDIKGVDLGNDAFIGALNFSGDLYHWITLYGSLSGSYWENWATYGIDIGVNFRW